MAHLFALADQIPLGRFRVEAEGHGEVQLVATSATLDEAVETVCELMERGGRLTGGARLVILDDETGEIHEAMGAAT